MNDHIQQLTDKSLHFALNRLKALGEFYPFAYAITIDGECITITPNTTETRPKSIDVITDIEKRFSQLKTTHNLSAVCICVNTTVIHNNIYNDAIEIRLDSINTLPTNIYYHYILDNNKVSITNSYKTMGSPLPFHQELNIFSLRSIADGTKAVLLIVHDQKGNWQFLTGEDVSIEELISIPISQLSQLDNSLPALTDIPIGYEAYRPSINDSWEITPSE